MKRKGSERLRAPGAEGRLLPPAQRGAPASSQRPTARAPGRAREAPPGGEGGKKERHACFMQRPFCP